MKKIYTIITLFSICNYIISQEINMGIKCGIGTYSMSSIKPYNYYISNIQSFDTKVVSNFPPYFYYQPFLLINYSNFGFGFLYTFQSTGSRVSALDYSGEYYFDMRIHSHSPAIISKVNLFPHSKYQVSYYTIIGILFSKLKTIHHLDALDSLIYDYSLQYKSLNYYIEPGISISYPLTANIKMEFSTGYFVQFGNKPLYNIKSDEPFLDPLDRQPIKTNWNGLRFGLSFLYKINKD